MDNKLKLYGGKLISAGGLMDFDGVTYLSTTSDTSANFNGNAELSFKLYLDNSTGYANNLLMISGAGGEAFSVFLRDSSIYISGSVNGNHTPFSIKDYSGQILNCQIKKNSSTTPTYFKINGEQQTPGSPTIGSTSTLTGTIIGGGVIIANAGQWTFQKLNNGTIWDVKLNASTGSLVRWWKGYPDGNLDSAWVDSVGGSFNLSVLGSPASREDIPNYSGTYYTIGALNKLQLKPVELAPITAKYGLLYNWYAITSPDGSIAPAGWHVPNVFYAPPGDFEILVGGSNDDWEGAIPSANFKSTTDWETSQGNNATGFNAYPAGWRDASGFMQMQKSTLLWSSELWDVSNDPMFFELLHSDPSTKIVQYYRNTGASLRLIKDDSNDPGFITDYEGNIYPTVTIGTQVWTAANWASRYFNNGVQIPEVTNNAAWAATTDAALSAYNNDWANVFASGDPVKAANNQLHLYLINQDIVDYSTTLTVNSRGNGSGVASVTMTMSAPTTLTLDGNARFYTDASGTLNESTTKNLSAGSNTIYVKNTSGSAILTFSDKRNFTSAGNTNGLGSGSPPWWSPIGSATNVPSIICNNWDFPNCLVVAWGYSALTYFTGNITQLSPNFLRMLLTAGGTWTGTTATMPRTTTLWYSSSSGTSNISGNIADLPPAMTAISLSANTTTGDIANLPSKIYDFRVMGTNTIYGNIKDFSTGMINVQLQGSNTITGDISTLDASMTSIIVYGSNTIYGDISTFKPAMASVDLQGQNTVSGDLKDLRATVTSLQIQGQNTIVGDIGTLKTGHQRIILGGNASTYGSIDSFPTTITNFTMSGNANNTISGNIANLSSSLTTLYLAGANTITGDISTLKSTLSSTFYVLGNNTIYGNINNLLPNFACSDFTVDGNNTITGVIDASFALKTITVLYIDGNNTISGDLAKVPSNVYYCTLTGQNTVDSYTSGRTWRSNMQVLRFIPVSPGGLSSSEVDNLFIDLNNSGCTAAGTIDIRGTNAAPTATSLTARNALISRGYTIYIN